MNTPYTSFLKSGLHPESLEKLLEPYYSPSRYYHNSIHLSRMVRYLSKSSTEPYSLAPESAMYIAILGHDTVQNYESSDVEKSIEFTLERIQPYLKTYPRSENYIRQLIAATNYEKTGVKALGRYCEDLIRAADLSILMATPDDYANYSHCVLKEIAAVKQCSIEDCYAGRLNFLKSLLPHFPLGYNDFNEGQAILNIRNEIQFLKTML